MSGCEDDEEEENMSATIGSSIFKVGMGRRCSIVETRCIHAAIVTAVSALFSQRGFMEKSYR